MSIIPSVITSTFSSTGFTRNVSARGPSGDVIACDVRDDITRGHKVDVSAFGPL